MLLSFVSMQRVKPIPLAKKRHGRQSRTANGFANRLKRTCLSSAGLAYRVLPAGAAASVLVMLPDRIAVRENLHTLIAIVEVMPQHRQIVIRSRESGVEAR